MARSSRRMDGAGSPDLYSFNYHHHTFTPMVIQNIGLCCLIILPPLTILVELIALQLPCGKREDQGEAAIFTALHRKQFIVPLVEIKIRICSSYDKASWQIKFKKHLRREPDQAGAASKIRNKASNSSRQSGQISMWCLTSGMSSA